MKKNLIRIIGSFICAIMLVQVFFPNGFIEAASSKTTNPLDIVENASSQKKVQNPFEGKSITITDKDSVSVIEQKIEAEKSDKSKKRQIAKKALTPSMYKIISYYYPEYFESLDDQEKLEVLDWNYDIIQKKIAALSKKEKELLKSYAPLAIEAYNASLPENRSKSPRLSDKDEESYNKHVQDIMKDSSDIIIQKTTEIRDEQGISLPKKKDTGEVQALSSSQYLIDEKKTQYSYHINSDEAVDPLYRTANQKSVELFLNGKKGLDFSLVRTYNSLDSKVFNPQMIAYYSNNVYEQGSKNISVRNDDTAIANNVNFIANGWSLNIPTLSVQFIEADVYPIYRNMACTPSTPAGGCESVWYPFLPAAYDKLSFQLDDGSTLEFKDYSGAISAGDYEKKVLNPFEYPYTNISAYKQRNQSLSGVIEYTITIDNQISYVFDTNGKIKLKRNEYGDSISYTHNEVGVFIKDSYNRDIAIWRNPTTKNIGSFVASANSVPIKSMNYSVQRRVKDFYNLVGSPTGGESNFPYWTLDSVSTTINSETKQIASYTYKDLSIETAADYNLGPHGYFYYAQPDQQVQHPYCACSRGQNNVMLWPEGSGVVNNFFETVDIEQRRQATYGETMYVLLDRVNLYNNLTLQYTYDKYMPVWYAMVTSNIGYREEIRGTTRLFSDPYALQYISYHPVNQVNYIYTENGTSKVLTDTYSSQNKVNGYSINEFLKSNRSSSDDINKRLSYATRYGHKQIIESRTPGAMQGQTKSTYREYEIHDNLTKFRRMMLRSTWVDQGTDYNAYNAVDSANQIQYESDSKEYTQYGYDYNGLNVQSISTHGSNSQYMSMQYVTHDAWGKVLTSTDVNNNVTTYEYNGPNHQISKSTLTTAGSTYTLTDVYEYYPANDSNILLRNELKRHTQTQLYPNPSNPNQSLTDSKITDMLEYNSNHLVSKTLESSSGAQFGISSMNTERTYLYTSVGQLDILTTKVTLKQGDSPTNLSIDYDYDVQGRIVKESYPDGNYISYAYDALDRMKESKSKPLDLPERITSYGYDDVNRTITMAGPDGVKKISSYTPFGLEISQKVQKDSDIRTLLLNETMDGVHVTKSIPYGLSTNATSNNYDSLGRIKSTVNAALETTTYSYANSARNLTTNSSTLQNTVKVLHPNGKVDVSFYDWKGQLVKTIENSPDLLKNRVSMFTYSPLGKMIGQSVVASGKTEPTTYKYDTVGNLIDVMDAKGQHQSYTFDRMGNILQTKTEGNIVNSYTYNEAGWKMKRQETAGTLDTYVYNNNGSLDYYTDSKNKKHDYDYFSNYQVKSYKIYDAGTLEQSETYAYDPVTQQVSKETNSENETIDYTYDKWGNPQTFKVVNRIYTLGYDANLRLNSLKFPDQTEVSYLYDVLSRLKNVTYTGMGSVDYSYTTQSNNSSYEVKYPNNNKLVKQYDSFGSVTNSKTYINSAVPSLTETNVSDSFGNITSIQNGSKSRGFQYDLLNRIEKETLPAGDLIYTYDEKGNRKTLEGALSFLSISDQDQDYSYNGKNQLVSTTRAGNSSEYTYYPNGLRATKETGNDSTRYIYFKGNIIEELDASNNVKARNIWGNELLYRKDNTSNKQGYYYYNGHGDVVSIKDGTGNEINNYEYDIWGNFTAKTEQMSNPFTYAGEVYDDESDLIYLRARYYDPSIGRFITKDTYEGQMDNPLSLNLYTYVQNNPLTHTDPTGHEVFLIHGTFSSNEKAWKPEFNNYVGELFNEGVQMEEWSGGNSNGARSEASADIFNKILEWHKDNPDEPIRLVGHSHGGNVAIMVANNLAKEGVKVETLITIATPVRGYKLDKDTKVGQHIQLYNTSDEVQVNGGSIWNLGGAKRKFKGAENVEVDMSFWSIFDPIDSHSAMHSNEDVWKKYIEPILK